MPFRDHATLVHEATKRGPLESLAKIPRLTVQPTAKHIDSAIFLARKGALPYVIRNECQLSHMPSKWATWALIGTYTDTVVLCTFASSIDLLL